MNPDNNESPVSVPEQPQQPEQPNGYFSPQQSPEPEPAQGNKKTPIKKILIIVGIVLVLVGLVAGVIFALNGIFGSTSTDTDKAKVMVSDKVRETNSFFVQEMGKAGLYAMFDGKAEKRVTEYSFASATDFINNTALVTNNEGDPAIIKDNGEMLADFATYSTIRRAGVFYDVVRASDKAHLLINSEGKEMTVPGGGATWRSYNETAITTDPNYDTKDYYLTGLYPLIGVGPSRTDPETRYILSQEGKELAKYDSVYPDGYIETTIANGVYSMIRFSNTRYILNNETDELVLTRENSGKDTPNPITFTYAKDDLLVLPVLTDPAKLNKEVKITDTVAPDDPDAYLIVKDGKITGEVPLSTCSSQFALPGLERMPSNNELVIFCNEQGKSPNKLLSTDGSTLATGDVFYKADTYLSLDGDNVIFHKDGKVAKTIKTCRGGVNSKGQQTNQHYVATDVYVVANACEATVTYATYGVDGEKIADAGEFNLERTNFRKSKLGVALKGKDGYIVDANMKVSAGPFNPGRFAEINGKKYYISSSSTSDAKNVIYTEDLKTLVYETDGKIKIESEYQSSSELLEGNTDYNFGKAVIFVLNDKGTYDYFNPDTKEVVASGIPKGAEISIYKWYIKAVNSDGSYNFYYRSGNVVGE